MEVIIRYKGKMDGRPYTCLYKTGRKESSTPGYFTTMMVPGSFRWIDNGNQADQEKRPAA